MAEEQTPPTGPAAGTVAEPPAGPGPGVLVRHAASDVEVYGLVVEHLVDEGAPDRVRVAWLGGGVSGPIHAEDFEVVGDV